MVLKLMDEKGPEALTTAREVCDRFKTPFDSTAKVMQLMNGAGILASQKGVKGGYLLQQNLNHISYLALAEIIEEKSFMLDCHQGPCELFHHCNISQPIKRLNDYVLRIFENLSIKELLSEDNLLALKKVPEEKIENCPLMNKASL